MYIDHEVEVKRYMVYVPYLSLFIFLRVDIDCEFVRSKLL
jgi:hypothetical protein